MSDNIRTALYDAELHLRAGRRVPPTPRPMLSRVVGKHCESGDIVVRDACLPADLAPGDLIAVAATGAYCRRWPATTTTCPGPPSSRCATAHARVIVRRETLDDLFRLDVG